MWMPLPLHSDFRTANKKCMMTPEAAHLSSDFRAAFSSVSRCTARTGSTSSFTATCAGMHACCVDLQSFMHQHTHASAHCEACRGVVLLLCSN